MQELSYGRVYQYACYEQYFERWKHQSYPTQPETILAIISATACQFCNGCVKGGRLREGVRFYPAVTSVLDAESAAREPNLLHYFDYAACTS